MSMKLVFAAAALGVALTAAPASARDRYYDFNQVWGDAVREHKRDEAISATPRDATRRQPRQVYDTGEQPHDPRGVIVLDGAVY